MPTFTYLCDYRKVEADGQTCQNCDDKCFLECWQMFSAELHSGESAETKELSATKIFICGPCHDLIRCHGS